MLELDAAQTQATMQAQQASVQLQQKMPELLTKKI